MSDPYNVCSSCGGEHAELSLTFSANFPDAYANLTVEEREARAFQSADQCIIDQDQFFVRGCIEIPIRGSDGAFLWGVWAQVEKPVFEAITEHWDCEGRETQIGPYEGLLANSVSLYPKTLGLRLTIQIMPVGTRPLFRVEDANHSLGIEQRYGITPEHGQEYACYLLRMAKT